ncbi:13589_t:CDS:2 [Ambispora leptoticha]|uniref:13589_t:CDS:1 n=1 Tax=Ambispora leptoticha TaxID=144679 RepID=A0A9N8VLB0_9GLOM|nr:13589_t:CDS:2 [Ambispora leptoticha]
MKIYKPPSSMFLRLRTRILRDLSFASSFKQNNRLLSGICPKSCIFLNNKKLTVSNVKIPASSRGFLSNTIYNDDPEFFFRTKNSQDKESYYLSVMRRHIDRSEKSRLVTEFANMKRERSIQSREFYHSLLEICIEKGNLDIALVIIKQMYTAWENERVQVVPIKETYRLLLDTMHNSKDYKLSLYVSNALIKGRMPFPIKSPDSEDAFFGLPVSNVECDAELWQFILRAMTSPKKLYSFWAVNSPFSATGEFPDFNEVDKLAREFLETAPKTFDYENWRVIIRGMGAYQGGGKEFVEFLQSSRIPINPEIWTEIIWALARKGLIKPALEYIKQSSSKFGPKTLASKEPIYVLASHYANLGDVKRTKELLLNMQNWVNDWACKTKWPELSKIKILMRAYLQSLANEVTLHTHPDKGKRVASRFYANPDDPSSNKERLIDSAFYKTWHSLEKKDIDLTIQFQVFANFLDYKSFPMRTAMDMLKNMRENEGLQPEFNTFKIVLEGFAKSPELINYASENQKSRIEYALEIFDMMKSCGYDVDALDTFRSMLETCLPPYESEITKKIDSWGIGDEAEAVVKKPSKSTPRIFEIEKLIEDSKLPIDTDLVTTVLEQLGSAGLYKAMWKHWDNLAKSGIQRNEKFYETVFNAAALNQSEAQYAISKVRFQMAREVPYVTPTLEIYTAMLQCCIRVNDTSSISDIVQTMQKNIDKTKNPRTQARWYVPIVNAYLHNSELVHKGKALISQLLQNDELLCFPLWRTLMCYYSDTHLDLRNARQTFESFVDWRERNKNYFFDSESEIKENNDGIGAATITSIKLKLPLIKFPSSPLYAKDTEIISIYAQIAIRCGDFTLARQILTSYVAHYEFQQAKNIEFIDIETLKEYAYLAWRKQQTEEMKWLLENVLNKQNKNDLLSLDAHKKLEYDDLFQWVTKQLENNRDFKVEGNIHQNLAKEFLQNNHYEKTQGFFQNPDFYDDNMARDSSTPY